MVLFPDSLPLQSPTSQQTATGYSGRIISTLCRLIGKKKKKRKANPERNKFSFALSAPIRAIAPSLSQALRALSKMRNSADLLRQSRERRRAFDRNSLFLASLSTSNINTLYKELYLLQVDNGEQGLSLV